MGEVRSLDYYAHRRDIGRDGSHWIVVSVDNQDWHYLLYSAKEITVEVLSETNGWGIVWMHEKYFVRHLKPEGCGTFLRGNATKGCTCKGKNKAEPIQVDPIVLAKFRILTLRENMK